MRIARPFLAITTAVTIATTAAHATLMVRRSIDDLVRESDVVVAATVGAARSSWSGGHIVTDVSVQLEQSVRGTVEGTTLTVRLPGGVVGDTGQRVDGAPSLQSGGRYMLFLRRDVPGRYFVSGMAQGVLPIVNAPDGTVRVMPARVGAMGLVEPSTNASPRVAVPDEGMALDRFVAVVHGM